VLSMVGVKERPMSSQEVDALLNERKKRWRAPKLKHTAGILKRYSVHAASAMKGAYLED
jgi:dihydroxy-acid dehydratase